MRETTTIKENAALIIASTALEINHVVCDCDSILTNIISWSNHTNIVDTEILAAAAIEYGKWTAGIAFNDILNARDKWFPAEYTPHNAFDDFSIWEIEESQIDSLWR